MKKKLLLFIIIPLLFAAIAVGGYFGYEAYSISKIPPVSESVSQIISDAIKTIQTTEPKTPEGKDLKEVIVNSWGFELADSYTDKREAVQKLKLSCLDIDSLYNGLQENAQSYLDHEVEKAKLSSEVYNDNLSFKEEILEAAAAEAYKLALENTSNKETSAELSFKYAEGKWNLLNIEDINSLLWPDGLDCDALAAEIKKKAVENPEYVRKTYTIEETAKAGPEPDRSKFGSTTDPMVIEELIATPLARQLINGQELVWNKDIAFIPGTEIHYYLDESILTIVWQEEEAMAVGTFAETFIADGSQFRRKIAGDEFENFEHRVATELSRQTNAVLAVGGDLYHHARCCGIVVYEREIYRFDPVSCDTCYITVDGDMLFSYRNQFSDISEAEKFVEENDILFSICFGPVLIDNGVDVTPDQYAWGEIHDTYARSALGLMGDKHYLTMNINCQLPDHYYLATLRQAADAMLEKGCVKAYALDGGQTASTIINNELINPVQFGKERDTSDILYFATAVPN
ncbi:MAG: phosphodiester glycosidase family protein [Oscillospiraceae bacterium]|nr:phosphodiester glycosidase family protein [Oscillospiraceae bacterium]